MIKSPQKNASWQGSNPQPPDHQSDAVSDLGLHHLNLKSKTEWQFSVYPDGSANRVDTDEPSEYTLIASLFFILN